MILMIKDNNSNQSLLRVEKKGVVITEKNSSQSFFYLKVIEINRYFLIKKRFIFIKPDPFCPFYFLKNQL